MTSHRILIVDDQKESTQIIRSSLESLEQDFHIDDVLSGEEALLELSSDPIDLLVADVRLPGISGLELMKKFKEKDAGIKVILVSGVTDQKIRQQVAQAGAEAFFFKPISLADFLDSVERILGLVESTLPLELKVEQEEAIDQEKEASGMSRRIAELRDELNASAVLFIGEGGNVLVRAGDLPDDEIETTIMPTLISAFNAGVSISQFLEQDTPDNLMSFRGGNYDLFLAPVGETYCLLVTTKPTLFREMGQIAKAIQTASKAVLMSLYNLGVSTQARIEKPGTAPKPAAEKKKDEKDATSDQKLEELLAKGANVSKQDADAFWESTEREEVPVSPESGDVLSYDQAAQLGLAPPED
jgi:CheY-like chemotaxis protein